jgi:phospholipid/cholesterol/gamma-HCH transport system ATP-binding protein
MTDLIEIRGLAKAFGERRVLAGLDLGVAAGESLVVIGQSGSGKSVLLKCILGLLKPDAGSIRIDGDELLGAATATLDAVRARIGMLFQGGALFDSLPVWRNVTFALTRGALIEGKAMHARAIDVLAEVGLEPAIADMRPAQLSGGMQKRVALARAIAARPEILFFDEPTTGLDPVRADRINRLIREQVTALGATAVTITHDMASARRIGDRIAFLHEGRIRWEGAPADLEGARDPLLRRFVDGQSGDAEDLR